MYNLEEYKNWYVLKTLTNNEVKLIDYLNKVTNRQYNYFVPQREVLHSKNGIVERVRKPLFPGYVFIHDSIHELLAELRDRQFDRKCHVVSFKKKPQAVFAHEMMAIDRLLNDEGVVPVSLAQILPGDNVKIIDGPLADLNAEVVFINKKKLKAQVRVSVSGQLLTVTLGLNFMAKDENAPRKRRENYMLAGRMVRFIPKY